jgi:dTMP kinase
LSRGRFITLEGGEGSGKSTHVKRLAEGLRGAGIEVLTTREPGGTPDAEAIRGLLVQGDIGRWDPVTEALLHNAARREHLTEVVWPALDGGGWVISDRFADSTTAYQGYGLGLDAEVLAALHRAAVGDFKPDLTVVLDLPVAEGLARAAARRSNEDRYERMGEEVHLRIRDGFLAIAKGDPDRCAVIDATGSIEATQAAIRAAVGARLGLELT